MVEHFVGTVDGIGTDDRKLLTVGDREIVVLKFRGRLYAYDNTCLHMGGPVGEGVILGKVESVIGGDGSWVSDEFSTDEVHLVCPWHGWEYDLETGAFAGNCDLRLRRYDVVQRGADVYVVCDE